MSEIANVLKALGESTPGYKIRDMVREVDIDENGTVEFDEFVKVCKYVNTRAMCLVYVGTTILCLSPCTNVCICCSKFPFESVCVSTLTIETAPANLYPVIVYTLKPLSQ